MATINGYTAERMKDIEDSSITDADVVGDNLILTKFDGTTINAGNVRGPSGPSGSADLAAQLAATLNMADPPGTPKPYTGAAVPSGHGLCDAATEYSSATYPTLAALYGTGISCINGASTVGTFRLPNLKGKMLVGKDAAVAIFDTLHEIGGSKDSVVVSHGHTATSDQSAHDHTADQAAHSHSTSDGGSHFHTGDVANIQSDGNTSHAHTGNGGYASEGHSSGNIASAVPVNIDTDGNHNHGNTGTSDPGITVGSADPTITTTVSITGVSGVDTNVPPYRVVNWIMRLA